MLAAVTALARLAEHVEECGRDTDCSEVFYPLLEDAAQKARMAGLCTRQIGGRFALCESANGRPVVVMRAQQRGA